MHPLATYLQTLAAIHAAGGVAETSGYGALAALLNEIGRPLKPRVYCVLHPQNRGAGIPDGGLFTADQLPRSGPPPPGAVPARGVIEVKGPGANLMALAESEQVGRYLARYGQVLLTNYRAFLLLDQDAQGRPQRGESYSLAPNEAAFRTAMAQPTALLAVHATRVEEYLKRTLLHAAPLTAPADLAWFLASYARDAGERIAGADLPALAAVRTALEEALGLRFEGAKGEHFFRSTLVQTLFYGIFSAWVLWCKHQPTGSIEPFDWHDALWLLHVPMIQALFEEVAKPSRLGPLDLVEVLDWTGAALNRVDRPAFFARFDAGHAVQYFYEPFLEAFDPELRKDLGVWYTPPELVAYQVARVDQVLRTELGIADGLADERVYVLDPACGTGAYLVEVLRHIHRTVQARGMRSAAPISSGPPVSASLALRSCRRRLWLPTCRSVCSSKRWARPSVKALVSGPAST